MEFEKIIGTHAGIVWRTLHNSNTELSFKVLLEETKLRVEDIAAAIGWLSREHKIFMKESKDGVLFSVYNECYY